MYVQGKAILFTTDIPNEKMECGKIEGVFATTDFGVDGIYLLYIINTLKQSNERINTNLVQRRKIGKTKKNLGVWSQCQHIHVLWWEQFRVLGGGQRHWCR
uniref:Uncharacterized protein n=1 Tax=Megaselia scalaris TaxID=36166 RepID=T1GGQ6_MEGSC